MSALARWADELAAWAIDPVLLAAAPESPYGFPAGLFGADRGAAVTAEVIAAVTPGSVLDVGCGGGAASLALAGAVTHVTGVDQQADMLAALTADAAARGVPFRAVHGRWPDAAADAGRADVVVCHHVLHNVVDLPAFVAALTAAAGRGVVVEMLGEHPMAWLDPLWVRFHDLHRPRPATTDDAVAVLHELGLRPTVERWERPDPPAQDPAWVTRRLCLPPEREPEVAQALVTTPPRRRVVATLVWS